MSTDLKVLQRNAALLRGRVLVCGPLSEPEAFVLADLCSDAPPSFLCDDKGTHERLTEAGFVSQHAAWPSESAAFDTVVVVIPAGKERFVFQLAQAAWALAAGGHAVVLGPNDLGARSAGPRIEQVFSAWEKVDFAQRWSLYTASDPNTPLAEFDSFRATWTAQTGPDETLTVVDYPGMFSRGELDDGTAMLLATLPTPLRGTVLDMGAGAGIIGCTARRRGASAVTLVEASAIALEGARATVAANGLDGVEVVASDIFSEVQGRWHWLLSNPPFHRQKATDLRVAQTLLTAAPEHIENHGELRIVANRFLPYAEPLRELFGTVQTLADDGRFRVLSVPMTPVRLRDARRAADPTPAKPRPGRGRAAATNARPATSARPAAGKGRGRR